MPLFQNESSCKIFHMKMSLIWINLYEAAGETNFHMNGFTRRLLLHRSGNGVIILKGFINFTNLSSSLYFKKLIHGCRRFLNYVSKRKLISKNNVLNNRSACEKLRRSSSLPTFERALLEKPPRDFPPISCSVSQHFPALRTNNVCHMLICKFVCPS